MLEGSFHEDATRPNPARMYDYFLQGKDNYAVDRQAAEEILKIAPETVTLVRENRAFLRRAVEFLIAQGIRQFLDIGTGIPSEGSVPDLVARAAPDAAVVCVDNDPVACAHARALTGGGVPVLEADMHDTEAILAAAREAFDLTRPVGLIMAAVLHFVTDDREAAAVVGRFRDALAPGSHVVLSHGALDGIAGSAAEQGEQVYRRSAAPTRLRTRDGIARLLDGCALVEPGLVPVALWRPPGPVHERRGAHLLGAVAKVYY